MTFSPPGASGREILAHLLELTPEPPCTDAEHLLAAFEAIDAARSEVFAGLTPPIALAEDDRPLLVELERRQALWQEALAQALRSVGGQRCGNTHLRAYAQPG
jgi:hypothetical protein